MQVPEDDLIQLAPGEEATFYLGSCVADTGLAGAAPETCTTGNTITLVPEPSVWLLQLAALVVLGLRRSGLRLPPLPPFF